MAMVRGVGRRKVVGLEEAVEGGGTGRGCVCSMRMFVSMSLGMGFMESEIWRSHAPAPAPLPSIPYLPRRDPEGNAADFQDSDLEELARWIRGV